MSFVQISFMARTCSSSFLNRVLKSVPWCSISSAFQPPPSPNSKRPWESRSRLATDLAVVMVSRSMIKQIPVPTRSLVVAAAAAVSATNGSSVCLYCSGSWPPANGLRRLVGMCVCSGTHSDSKLRASASRASSSMRIAYSVAKMQTPTCMSSSVLPGGPGGGARGSGHEREVRVGGEPAAITALEGDRAAAGAGEQRAIAPPPARIPGGGEPAAVAGDDASRALDVDGEIPDHGPDVPPLLALHHVEAGHEGRHRAEGHDVLRAERAPGREVDGADACLPGPQPIAQRGEMVVAHPTKIASGRKAETIQFGASTISLILRSAATEQTT